MGKRRRFAWGVYANFGAMWEHVAIFGTSESVAERIKGLRQSGIENLIFFINYGRIENRKVLDSSELFAAKVMPSLKDEPPGLEPIPIGQTVGT